MEYILQTHDLTKTYGKKDACKDININIREGEIYGLIGRNGAGKTTIMRMISGLSNPTSGSYALFGKEGAEMRKMMNKVGELRRGRVLSRYEAASGYRACTCWRPFYDNS